MTSPPDDLAKPLLEQERGGQGNGPALPSSTACHFQVLEDLRTIWNWVVTEKLHINPRDRGLYSAILVLGKTFGNLGISPFVIHRILRCKVGSPVYEVHLYVLMKS